jgi:hypothetical protein
MVEDTIPRGGRHIPLGAFGSIVRHLDGKFKPGTIYNDTKPELYLEIVQHEILREIFDGVCEGEAFDIGHMMSYSSSRPPNFFGIMKDLVSDGYLTRMNTCNCPAILTDKGVRVVIDQMRAQASNLNNKVEFSKQIRLKEKLYYQNLKRFLIEDKDRVYVNSPDDIKWQAVDRYAADNPGFPVSDYVKELFPQLANKPKNETDNRPSELPVTAPQTWIHDREAGENAPDFIKRVYEPWLGKGLARTNINQLDPQLYLAFNRWLSRPGNTLPDDLDLPTRKEVNDRIVADVMRGDPVGEHTLKEASRISSALQRRGLKRGSRGE